MIEYDLAVIIVVWVFLVEFDHYLYSPGFDVIEILLIFRQAILVPLEVNKDPLLPLDLNFIQINRLSFFLLDTLKLNALADNLGLCFWI